MERTPLAEIALAHGTDKLAHGYVPFYEQIFERRRHEQITLLEIGVGGDDDVTSGGASLRMWRDYFSAGQIVGLDLHDKSAQAMDRVVVERGDQSDTAVLRNISEQHGPFDAIIDDGSHQPAHVVTTFEVLFPRLKPGGWYVIEDCQTSYWPSWGGSFRVRSHRTTMGYFKGRTDRLNVAEFRRPVRQDELDAAIGEVRFAHNLVLVRRANSSMTEPPKPQWNWFEAVRHEGLATSILDLTGLRAPLRRVRKALRRPFSA